MPFFLAQAIFTLQSLGSPQAIIALDAPLKHVQGIETDGKLLWVSSVDKEAHTGHLHVFELATGKLRKTLQIASGEIYHPGGISFDGDSLWVPVAVYNRVGRSRIEQRDKHTLELRSYFSVADHIGCLAASQGTLYGGNWDSLKLYTWNEKGAEIAVRPNPQKTRYQDMKIRNSMLIASGVVDKEKGAVDWLSPDTLKLLQRIETGKTDRGTLYSNEGMTVFDNRLYLLPEDGPSRLFVFLLK